MSEIINLRRVRKKKARAAKESEATANRAAFGRSKGEKRRSDLERQRAEKDLEGKKRQ